MSNLTEIKKQPDWLTIPLLSKSLGSQSLDKHRAFIALELEILSKKFDRFGWDRDRGSIFHDRMILDWMDSLHDFGLDEVRSACRQAVNDFPNKQPNEGHIRNLIMKSRSDWNKLHPKTKPSEPEKPRPTADQKARVAKIIRDAGFGMRVKK